jgi:hypothetical protein
VSPPVGGVLSVLRRVVHGMLCWCVRACVRASAFGRLYSFLAEPTPSPLTSELLAQMAADIEALKAKVGL